jgi:hypothetical protein
VFLEDWPLSRDFALLPPRYRLRNGAELRIYQRMRDTLVDDAVRDLAAMRRIALPQSIGPPRPWVALDPFTSWTTAAHDAAHLVVGPGASARHLLSTAEPAGPQWTVDVTLRSASPGGERVRLTVHAAEWIAPAGCEHDRHVDCGGRVVQPGARAPAGPRAGVDESRPVAGRGGRRHESCLAHPGTVPPAGDDESVGRSSRRYCCLSSSSIV